MGSNFVRFFYDRYPAYRIINFDALTYAGNPDNLADIEERENGRPFEDRRYVFLRGDISDERAVESLFNSYRFDALVHLAAESHVDRSIVSVANFIRTNIEGTRILMEEARKRQIPKFIHISTDEVYGNVPEGFSDEKALLNPSNPYAASKAGADLMVQSYVRTHRLPAIIVRPSNNYGPYQYPEKIIPIGITSMLAGRKIPIHGTGRHVRSWLHVEDFCVALDCIFHHGKLGEIYNIPGVPADNLEILRLVAKHLGKKLETHLQFVNDRPAADFRYAVDGSKLSRELLWRGKHNPKGSISAVVEWYLKNERWWRKIFQTKEFLDQYEKQSNGRWG